MDDLKRPGDDRRRKPAIPMNQREKFVGDVKSGMTLAELSVKWKRFIPQTQTGSLRNWKKWAEGVIEKREKNGNQG